MSWVLLLISAPPGAGNGRRKIVPERSKSLQEFLAKEARPGRGTRKAPLSNFLRVFATFVATSPLLGTRFCCQQSSPASTADTFALVLQAGTGGGGRSMDNRTSIAPSLAGKRPGYPRRDRRTGYVRP